MARVPSPDQAALSLVRRRVEQALERSGELFADARAAADEVAIDFSVAIGEVAGHLIDLRERLDARSAPRGPEIEDDDRPLSCRETELRSGEHVELEIGGRLADEGRFLTAGPVG